MKIIMFILTLVLMTACSDEVVREKGAPIEPITPKAVRLDRYVESFDVNDLGFTPQMEVVYSYDDNNKLTSYTEAGFNPETGASELQRSFTLSYSGTKVDSIKGYLSGAVIPYLETSYTYLPDGRVSRIDRIDRSSGVNSEASFAYQGDNLVRVTYTFSNGGSFQYEFDYAGENVQHDKTTRGAQLCSNGVYTYDQHKNPFWTLGFVDYTLTNISMNNRLTEQVNYLNCAFPTLVPIAHEYEYNAEGYPSLGITHYDPHGAIKESRKEFFYTTSD